MAAAEHQAGREEPAFSLLPRTRPKPTGQCASWTSVHSLQMRQGSPVKIVQDSAQKIVKNCQSKILSSILAVSAASIAMDAGAGNATLFIDLIPVSPTRTLIKTSGSLNLGTGTPLNPSFTSISGPGLNPTTDVLRFTPASTPVQGRYYSFTGINNPFTGSPPASCVNGNCLAAVPPGAIFPVPFLFNRNTVAVQTVPAGSFWIANSYTGGSILNSFFLDISLAQIGLSSPEVTYTLNTGTTPDFIVFRENPVPGPLPILGAATAFSFSRRLRSRVRSASKAEQPQQA